MLGFILWAHSTQKNIMHLLFKPKPKKINWESGNIDHKLPPLCHQPAFPAIQYPWNPLHYSGVIMGSMASRITFLIIVYSTVYSGIDQRKHQSSASLACVRGIHRWLPAQMASNAQNVSIWWRHHGSGQRYKWEDADMSSAENHGSSLQIVLISYNVR